MENWLILRGLISVLWCTRKTRHSGRTKLPQVFPLWCKFKQPPKLNHNNARGKEKMPQQRQKGSKLSKACDSPAAGLMSRSQGKLLKSWCVREGLGRIKMKIVRHHSHQTDICKEFRSSKHIPSKCHVTPRKWVIWINVSSQTPLWVNSCILEIQWDKQPNFKNINLRHSRSDREPVSCSSWGEHAVLTCHK